MKTEPNEPAFPVLTPLVGGEGLTKREYFAGLAMHGMMIHVDTQTIEDIMMVSVKAADFLIEELNKSEQA